MRFKSLTGNMFYILHIYYLFNINNYFVFFLKKPHKKNPIKEMAQLIISSGTSASTLSISMKKFITSINTIKTTLSIQHL